ncbi:unnamed protein product [Calicophoron daubneyi]|uniref:Saposin B-type domain-containing protein n=1 Tax=Calicophoron daubneyi TaxID=300641 RepID=A0AAV2T028_CALDB
MFLLPIWIMTEALLAILPDERNNSPQCSFCKEALSELNSALGMGYPDMVLRKTIVAKCTNATIPTPLCVADLTGALKYMKESRGRSDPRKLCYSLSLSCANQL